MRVDIVRIALRNSFARGQRGDMRPGNDGPAATGSQTFVAIMNALCRAISTRTAITLVNQALTELGLTPESLERGDVSAVVEVLRPGLRVFCQEGDLDRVLSALRGIENGTGASATFAIDRAQRARQVTVRLPKGILPND